MSNVTVAITYFLILLSRAHFERPDLFPDSILIGNLESCFNILFGQQRLSPGTAPIKVKFVQSFCERVTCRCCEEICREFSLQWNDFSNYLEICLYPLLDSWTSTTFFLKALQSSLDFGMMTLHTSIAQRIPDLRWF